MLPLGSGSIVNTNMALERANGLLKHKFLKGKQNRRIDYLLGTLLEIQTYYRCALLLEGTLTAVVKMIF